ncbi:hypothetical protein CR103_06280 [Massilia psychrophila]|uniref:Uncharacterized protein n=1 Tax=Massilia psychrophila TaxID=1603353 RepID=A0A2G8T3Z1_9BURK|nr:hypothetical protein CR103_06280 [Massilia psychrophila]
MATAFSSQSEGLGGLQDRVAAAQLGEQYHVARFQVRVRAVPASGGRGATDVRAAAPAGN